MIDLKTGIVEIEGVVMGPDSKLEDFKKYDTNLVDVDVWEKGWGIITIKKWIRSNGIDASVKFRIDEGENSRQIIIEPTLGSTEMQYATSLEWMNLILMKYYMLSVVLTIMVLTIFHHSMRMISIMFQEKRYVTF